MEDHSHVPRHVNPQLQTEAGSTAGVQLALDALVQQSRGLTPNDVTDLMAHLDLLMKDCSQANIQAGKNWVVQYCQNPLQYDLLSRVLVAIAISRNTFTDKLHIIYLTNDILSHSERRQQPWIKDAMYPHLVPILRVAYFFPGVDNSERNRVTKVLDIWRNKEYFPVNVVDTMEVNVKRPPLIPPPGAGGPVPAVPPNPAPPFPQAQNLYQQQQQQQYSHQQQYPHQQNQQQHHAYPHHAQFPLQLHQQAPPPYSGSWSPSPASHLAASHHTYPPPPFAPAASQQQTFGQSNMSSAYQHPSQNMQPGFQQPPFPPHPQPHQQQFPSTPSYQQQQHQQPQALAQGIYYPPPMAMAPVSTPAPAPIQLPPPEPTHREVLTRDLPAGLMVSKADADYYESLPAYISVPVKSDSIPAQVLESVTKFLATQSSTDNNSNSGDSTCFKDEGWHEGSLSDFYKTVGDKRQRAFAKDPPPSRDRGSRGGGKARDDSRDKRKGRSYSRSKSRSRSLSRSKSPSWSRARGRSRSYSRSRSRSRPRLRSKSRSPIHRHRGRRTHHSYEGPQHQHQQHQQQPTPSRPVFQPARHT
ncbi:hypothetical protein EDD11_006109 [Mortierella claussenii]|nr:hypothetical protein EDD11_006109 [Mortierella claussenii]